MGSGFYSIKEAALRLNKSERSVYGYIKNGFIKKTTVDGQARLDREDVDLLAVDLGSDAPALNRKTFFQMQSQLKKLQDQMGAVMHILEMRSVPPLRPDAPTSTGILHGVQHYMSLQNREEHWTQAKIGEWASILERIDEQTLSAFVEVSNNPQAWVPVFKYCAEMADFCWEQDRKTPSLSWQALAGRMETVRKGLRASVVVWAEMNTGTLPSSLIEVLGSQKEALVARLVKGA